jgi:membrane-associated protease RseP (regulator of RpoE activity)
MGYIGPAYLGAAVVALCAMTALLVAAAAAGRWCAVRALGVRGVRFPFGAGTRWAWAAPSPAPALLTFAASVVALYAACGAVMAAGAACGREEPDVASMRVEPLPGGPADRAGVRAGDRIDAVGGEPVHDWDGLKAGISAHAGEPVDLAIDRDGQAVHLTATIGDHGKLRVAPVSARHAASAGDVLAAFATGPLRIEWGVVRGLASIAIGRERAEVTGPVGIVKETARQEALGAGPALTFAGALGAYLLPIFALVSAFVGPGRRPRGRAAPAPARRTPA